MQVLYEENYKALLKDTKGEEINEEIVNDHG